MWLRLILVGILCTVPAPLLAQERFSFADPQRMMETFFGPQTDEERRRLEAVELTAAEEDRCGEEVLQAFMAQLKSRGIHLTSRGADVDYLRKLVEEIRPQMRNAERYKQIRIYIAESPLTDARSIPGGTLVFFRGLLDYVESEAALVGVIGHELSHLDHGHQLVHLRSMKLAQETFSGQQRFAPEQFFERGTMFMRLFGRPFRPEDELQADLDGATWAYRAGYDPRAMAELFLRWQQRDQQRRDPMLAFFRTHPYHLDRHEAVMRRYEELQKAEPRQDLQRRGRLNR